MKTAENPEFELRNASGEAIGWLYRLEWPSAPMWSQRDPRWSKVQLGFGSTTIGQYGCLITDLAMAITKHADVQVTPIEFNAGMKVFGAYSGPNKNLLDLTAPPRAWSQLQLVERASYPKQPAPVVELAKAVTSGEIVIAQIDFDLTDPDIDEHWILLVESTPDGSKFVYHDPWMLPADQRKYVMPPGYCKQGWLPSRALTAHVRYRWNR